jgi:nucleoside-diphosphate-sugar epimerase
VESRLAAAELALTIVEPGIVHGHGAGIPAMLASAPVTAGRLTVIGDGTQHWATVHVDDLAELYVRVIERSAPVGRVLGLSGHNATVTELGEALADGPVAAEGVEASRARLGAPSPMRSCSTSRDAAAKARSLGWTPTRPSLLEEIRAGATARPRRADRPRGATSVAAARRGLRSPHVPKHPRAPQLRTAHDR